MEDRSLLRNGEDGNGDERGLLRNQDEDDESSSEELNHQTKEAEEEIVTRPKGKRKSSKKKSARKDLESSESGGEDADNGEKQTVYCVMCGMRNDVKDSACYNCRVKLIKSEDDELVDRSRKGSYDPFATLREQGDIIDTEPSPRSPPIPPTAMLQTETEIYEVRFEAGKSGISFEEDWLGKALVVDELPEEDFLVPFADGSRRNIIHTGDFVVAINEESCVGVCLERVEEMLDAAQANGPHKIRFRQAIRIQDAFADDRGEAYEARSIIYKQKSQLYEPPEHMDMVYGYILRYRGESVISFHFFRESDNKFLLAAVMPRSGKGRIVFHNDPTIKLDGELKDVPVHSESARFLGSMVSNFIGTTFTMHDYRVENATSTRKTVHHELGCVMYDSNVFGRVPNTLKAVLPRWDPEQGLRGQPYSISARYNKSSKTRLSKDLNLLQMMKSTKGDEYMAVELEEQEDLLTFETKQPSWNEDLQAWTLNFNGRVKLASKKNFLLVPNAKNEAMDEEFGADTVCLRFGKVLKDRFSLDFRHPISPFQAFGIALTTFSNKLVVT